MISPPAITEAICPLTLAPAACISRKLPESSSRPILWTTREAMGKADIPAAPIMGLTFFREPVSKTTRILFPIFVTVIAGTVAPKSAELIGFLMFGNLIRECGVLDSLSQSAQHELANLITLLLGLSVSFKMKAEWFVG